MAQRVGGSEWRNAGGAEPCGRSAIPNVRYSGRFNRLTLRDYGPQFGPEGGIVSLMPPRALPGQEYRVLVPKVDADGNDVAGLRRPDDLGAPVGTHTGWNHRRAGFRSADLCGLTGSYIPFPKTRAERAATGDPRLSLEERYPTKSEYVSRIVQSAVDYAGRRLLLAEDVARMEQAASEGNAR